MGRPMKKQTLASTTPSRWALFILINIMVGQAAADEPDRAAESATVLSLQQSFAHQKELMAIQTEQLERQQQQIREQSERLQNLESQLQQLALAHNGANMNPSEQQAQIMAADSVGRQPSLAASSQNSEIVTQEMEAAKQLRDPEKPIEVESHSLPGYLQIPGTDASMKLGGYVKMSIVQSFDPVGSADRFTPGSIPVPADPDDLENQTNLTRRRAGDRDPASLHHPRRQRLGFGEVGAAHRADRG